MEGRAHRRIGLLPGVVVVGSLFGLAATAVLVVGPALQRSPSAPKVPPTIEGLSVQSVSQALAEEAAGNPTGDELVAIGGWIDPMPLHSCPASPSFTPALVDSCTSDLILMTETRQDLVMIGGVDGGTSIGAMPPSAPYVYAHELAGVDIGSLVPSGDKTSPDTYRPLQAVMVGHFDDAGVAQCDSDQRAACESAFVVDQLAWLDGKSLGPNVWIDNDYSGAVLQPRVTGDGLIAALRPSLDPADTVVSAAAVTPCGIATFTTGGSTPGGNCPGTLWYVRVAGPAPKFPPMPWGAGDSGWMVLDDATGRILGAGGWGFVSATGGTFEPSPQPGPNGLYWLATDNWLTG